MRWEVTVRETERGERTLRAAWTPHPSESSEGFALRVLAGALLMRPGLAAREELCRGDEPAFRLPGAGPGRDALRVELGLPSAARLRKARSAAEEVWVVAPAPGPRWTELLRRLGRVPGVRALGLPREVLRALASGAARGGRLEVERRGAELRVRLPSGEEHAGPLLEAGKPGTGPA